MQDVDACLAGAHGVVLAAGRGLPRGRIDSLARAYASGLRHLQLVHYVHSPVGDLRRPRHHAMPVCRRSGELIAACNARGHPGRPGPPRQRPSSRRSGSAGARWSGHGWCASTAASGRGRYGYQKRALSLEHARRIAAADGVVGLWGAGAVARVAASGQSGAARDTAGYARELVRPSQNRSATVTSASARTSRVWAPTGRSTTTVTCAGDQPSGSDESRLAASIGRMASGGNYAQVLKTAMAARHAVRDQTPATR